MATPGTDLRRDPEHSARAADLEYVSDDLPGITRKPWGQGFTYLDPEGRHITEGEERERLESLAIPPAWTDVWICPSPRGHILATGRDDAGRKQYIYHPEWEAHRQRQKFDRLLAFARALPAIRARCAEDLSAEGLPRLRVLALVVRLLDLTLIRVGHSEYADSNDTFGLASMRDRHVDFEESGCTFSFTGKSGKEHEVTLDDAQLARLVRQCRDVPGKPLFQFVDENGTAHPIDAGEVNAYLKDTTGEDFTAKHFRTWGGTVAAARVLCSMDAPADPEEADKQLPAVVKEVAEILGNTPAICREYYIHPRLIEAYREGIFHEEWPACCSSDPPPQLQPDEAAVLRLLERIEGS